MHFAYADPPYLGCCKLYGHRHEEPWGCWDDPETHRALLDHLHNTYDGWAYSLSEPSLDVLLPLAPPRSEGRRTGAWTKSFSAYKRNVRIAYTWEPVFFKPGRDSSKDGAPVGRDHLRCPIALQRGLTGAKPEVFCEWVKVLVGWVPGDDLTDVFPGTGVMSDVLAQGALL